MTITDIGERTDAQLLQASRDGDRHAFSELWRRHAAVAVAYARSLGAAPPDPEDVVSDSFLSILRLVRAGQGPENRFRPYLLTTVRNTWLAAARRDRALVELDETAAPESQLGRVDVEAMASSEAVVEAFRSLPERWQHALWLSEVEQLPPRAIAEVLGLRPNSVAALTYRARDALRKGWIRAHLRSAPDGTEHARVIELLGGYAHDDLSARSRRVVERHLPGCRDCTAAAGEARHLAKAFTIGPLLVAGGGLAVAPAFFAAAPASAVAWPVAASVAAVLAATISGGMLAADAPQLEEAAPVSAARIAAAADASDADAPDAPDADAPVADPDAPERTEPSRPAPAAENDRDRPPHDRPEHAADPPGGGLGAPPAPPGPGGRAEEAAAHAAEASEHRGASGAPGHAHDPRGGSAEHAPHGNPHPGMPPGHAHGKKG